MPCRQNMTNRSPWTTPTAWPTHPSPTSGLADDTAISGATGSTYTLVAGDVDKAIKVRVSFTDDAGNAETLTSAATSAVAKPPLTATVHDGPESHDGSNSFTFELRFSENMESFSYSTLQNHSLTVTGGTLPKVRRLEAGKNVRWEIPSSRPQTPM